MAKLIEQYVNKAGKIVLQIYSTGKSYRYSGSGSLGAGCGQSLTELKQRIFNPLTARKQANFIKVELSENGTVLKS